MAMEAATDLVWISFIVAVMSGKPMETPSYALRRDANPYPATQRKILIELRYPTFTDDISILESCIEYD